jgi:hypothetical protein
MCPREIISPSADAPAGMLNSDIRHALREHLKRQAGFSDDLLFAKDLGLAHHKSRIDLTALSPLTIHGYQIKSDRNTLIHVEAQIKIYEQTLPYLTFVVTPMHVNPILEITPDWCGILTVIQQPINRINFSFARHEKPSPKLNPIMLAHILRQDEAIELLNEYGYAPKELNQPRNRLYHLLTECMTVPEIIASIRDKVAKRKTWREPLPDAPESHL